MAKFIGVDRALTQVAELLTPVEEMVQESDRTTPGVLIDLAQVKATVALVSAVTALTNIVESKK